jgi:hypothetical protein
MGTIEDSLSRFAYTSLQVDLALLQSTAGLTQYDVLGDVAAYEAVDKARFQLSHVARIMDMLCELSVKSPKGNMHTAIAHNALIQIQKGKQDCQKAIAELEKLDPPRQPDITSGDAGHA